MTNYITTFSCAYVLYKLQSLLMQGQLYTINALIVLFTCNKHLHVLKTDFILQFEVCMISGSDAGAEKALPI